jgi:hypothetical protein
MRKQNIILLEKIQNGDKLYKNKLYTIPKENP